MGRIISKFITTLSILSTMGAVIPAGQVPIAFELRVDASRIDPRHTYAIGARIEAGSRLLWINTEQIRLRLDGGDELRVRVDQVGG